MAHILDIVNFNLRQKLYSTAVPPFVPQVIMELSTRTGTPGNFSTTFTTETVDVTDRIAHNKAITISKKKPLFPALGKVSLIEGSLISLPMLAPDGFWAVSGDDGIINEDKIELATVWIEAAIELDSIGLFRGRVTGRPKEDHQGTLYKLESRAQEIINRPVLYENFTNGPLSLFQKSSVKDDKLVNQSVEIFGNPTVPADSRGTFRVYDGIALFDEEGRIRTSVENDDQDGISLIAIFTFTEALLGVYLIEFLGPNAFRVTHPDNSVLFGSVNADFIGSFFSIAQVNWVGIPTTGQKIEFTIRVTYCGNPITMAKNLLEKAFKRNYGEVPTFTGVPVNWDNFDELENRFRSYTVFVSDGNNDNNVWERRRNARPLSHGQLIQRILDHVGCTLTEDSEGNIDIIGPYIYDDPVHPITDLTAITKTTIDSMNKINFAIYNYGGNKQSGSLGGKLEDDLREDPDDFLVEETFNLPYYKVGVSDNAVEMFRGLMRHRFLDVQKRISTDLTPNFAAPLRPGDRSLLISNEIPRFSVVCEAVKTSVTATGGIWRRGKVNWVQVQEPEGEASLFDSHELCDKVI